MGNEKALWRETIHHSFTVHACTQKETGRRGIVRLSFLHHNCNDPLRRGILGLLFVHLAVQSLVACALLAVLLFGIDVAAFDIVTRPQANDRRNENGHFPDEDGQENTQTYPHRLHYCQTIRQPSLPVG